MQQSEFDSYVKAGEISKEIKKFARGLIKPGIKLIDVAEAVDAKIFELGGVPAFPVNLSLNEVAAHYTPAPGDDKVAEGILKVDLGVAVDGFIADTAFSVDLTEDGEYKEMIELNEKILSDVTEIVKPGVLAKDVGDKVQDTLEEWNSEKDSSFAVIKSLSGHALGKDSIHAGLTISNYRNENGAELDGAFAIEPFVTTGVGDIYEGPTGGIYVLQSDENVRDRDAREVLKFIKETFVTRPFCLRFLVGEFDMSLNKLKLILKGMVKRGILHEYPMLIEKSKGPVSQAENTFVIRDDSVVCTTG
ncbi:type II methionyl aminopeptidase [archaeon]|nr:type II methionyl aminopeptidase [archaeon]